MTIFSKYLHMSPLLAGVLLSACTGPRNAGTDGTVDGRRVLDFAGYRWLVKTSHGKAMAPGHNYFSDSKDNVWVDGSGKLHLRITYRDGVWNCAQVIMLRSYGYGQYSFQIDSRVDYLDKNIVGGLYTYQNDSSEIDIEFSKWSLDSNRNSQFVTQPGSIAANKKRYQLDLSGTPSTHRFNWQPDHIDFESYRGYGGTPTGPGLIQSWTYRGPYVPKDADETVRINLWLFRGKPPADGQEAEMVLSGFSIR